MLKEKLEKTLESTKSRFGSIRTGRANPDLLSRVQVEYYGSLVPINQVASIAVVEGNTFVLNVFDKSAVDHVEKAIFKSDLNMTPQRDGLIIRMRLPDLTQERRQELLKLVKQEAEEGKVAMRHIRRDHLDGLKKEGELSDDEMKKEQESVQKVLDGYIGKLDEMVKDKEKELLTI